MDQKIIEDVKKVAYEVLKDERALSEEDFNMTDSENMDSIHRVSILTALEEEYDIIFKLKEISSWNTINELAAILEKKL
jgi:acyl carrier protein